MTKFEPTIETLPVSSEFSGVFEEKEERDVSRENIVEMCNESFLLRGHTVSTLEKYLEKARSAEDFHFVVDAIEYLERRAENEPYHELEKDDLMPFLEGIAQKDISYFVRENARVNLRVPLELSSVRYKRKLLQLEFENIRQEGVAIELFGQNDVRLPADIDALDDAIVIRAFHLYGEMNPAYYRWNEWMSLQQRFHEESLDRRYDISDDHEEALYDDIWSIQHERRRREQSILSRISDRFGVLYDAGGSVESFFELDEKAEKREKLKEDVFGKISESHLEYFIDFFSSSERSNEEKTLRYIQVRPRLPKMLIEDFERRFPVFIPNKLQKDFRTQDDFEDESESFRKSILSSVSEEEQVRMMEDLAGRLSKLLHERQEIDRKENFGVASEDAENLLDFSLSNIILDPEEVQPTAHGSICYYLFLRNKLPLELVHEFETRFDLKIPDQLKGFVSHDRYLKTNDRELIAAINSGNVSLEEMRGWLLEKIGTLKEKIQSKKVLTKKLSFQELLKREGLESNLVEDKNFEARYRFLLHPVFRKKIEDDFGIELKDFSVRVQVQFLNFLFEKNEEEVKRVIAFLKNGNGTDRLKSFLSLEQGGADMGERILAIGEKLPKEAADRVFAKYAEMAEVAEGAAEYVEKSLKAPEKSSPGVVARIAETLLFRAKNMLVEFSELDAATENDLQALFAKLDSFRTDIELYKATLTAFARSGEPLGLDDMEQSRFESVSAQELSELDRGIMRDMYLRNIAGSPEKVRAKLLANLDQNFENPDAIFSVFRYENRVEGFLCFSQSEEEKARGEKFGSAFNVNPDFQKGTIGMMMHEEATNREAKSSSIRIECLPGKRSSARYIESGFVGTRLWDDDGESVLDAVRNDREENRFRSKSLSREEILSRDGAGERDNILVCSFEKTEDIPFDRYIGTYALTRYFFDAQKNRWFLAFEKSTKTAF